jgi:hypothetical protein
MPSAYGDYCGFANGRGGDANDPAFLHAISKLQYALMRAWMDGDFIADWGQASANPQAVTPDGLDRAALDNMSGGAFYPGMEASWLFAKADVWRAPFRVARGKKVGTLPVPGDARRDLLLEAGAFSQQMALPWQADFFECSAAPLSDPSSWVDDPSIAGGKRRVGWWPANRPDEIFSLDSPRDRRPWARVAAPTEPRGFREMQNDNEMVNLWSTLGFIVETSPDGEHKDLYEVEFDTAAPLVAEAFFKRIQDAKPQKVRKPRRRKKKA